MTNYKSIGNFAESEILIEPQVTAIIGKNESGKSNILSGLSQIDFIGNNSSAYSLEKINRNSVEGSKIQYTVIVKPSPEDIENGIVDDTTIVLTQNNYNLTGGLLTYYKNKVKCYIDPLVALIESFGSNPLSLRDQEYTNYKARLSTLKDDKNLNVPKLLDTLTYFKQRKQYFPEDSKERFESTLEEAQKNIREFLYLLPHFYYRNTNKNLKTAYKLDEVEKELKPTTATAGSLLLNLVMLIGVSPEEFISAVKAGASPNQISSRKKISRLVSEKINVPFAEFYQTEKVYLDLDFNTNLVSFTVQSEDGAALLLNERSNGLRWYLETFIDAKAHNIPNRNAVYLFDEPGVSLHVNAQKELIKLFHHLAEQGNQIVYTTHSPYMLDMEENGVHRIRAVVKDNDGFSKIYKTAYDPKISPDNQKDTLAPIINAIGMNLNDTFGPAKDKINIVTEGMSDYIYICLMATHLKIPSEKYAIIPSVGASNCVNLCSILQGWGCKYIAVFDYDKEGVESGGEYLRKKMYFEKNKQYCYIKEVTQDDIDSKTYKKEANKYAIEDLVTREEIHRFCEFAGIDKNLGKPLIAKLLSNAVKNGSYTLGETCINNFKELFERITKYVS